MKMTNIDPMSGTIAGCPNCAQMQAALNRIEQHPDRIIVRHGNRNVPLSQLPTIEALHYVCKWLRRFTEEA